MKNNRLLKVWIVLPLLLVGCSSRPLPGADSGGPADSGQCLPSPFDAGYGAPCTSNDDCPTGLCAIYAASPQFCTLVCEPYNNLCPVCAACLPTIGSDFVCGPPP